jgi:diadenylate cyclase
MKIDFSAIIEITILYLAIYAILKSAKGTRFGQALLGVGVLAAISAIFSFVLHFDVLSKIVHLLLIYLALSTVVIFQPEIRRILATVGAFGTFERPQYDASGAANPELIVKTILALAHEHVGALIAFERGISLRGYEETGVRLDAVFSRELLRSVFTPPLPLHDGGLTIRAGRVSAAHCLFPVSNNPHLVTGGMRHRAAVGLSEETDALVIVVSEETGAISVAHNGRLTRYTGNQREASLHRWVRKAMRANEQRRSFIDTLLDRIQEKTASHPAEGERTHHETGA